MRPEKYVPPAPRPIHGVPAAPAMAEIFPPADQTWLPLTYSASVVPSCVEIVVDQAAPIDAARVTAGRFPVCVVPKRNWTLDWNGLRKVKHQDTVSYTKIAA